jgi:uncharacterized protein with ParB-like and HNH nuclease domain/predicted transport protein
MQASSANLLRVIQGPKQFIIPIYQRTYSWQISQCNSLFNDILRISRDKLSPWHFVGSIVYFQESIHVTTDVPQLLVIDGQQRITTISLLIAALAEYIRDNAVEGIDTSFTRIQNYYLLNADETGERRYKLILNRRDKETFINVINGVPPDENSSLRIVENFKFFKDQINWENVVEVYNGILKLFIVEVALEKGVDNPQLIFESLNSTGLDLSQADLIRNYILMTQEIKLQTELYEKHWYPMEQSFGNDYAVSFDFFMRDYLSVKMGKIPKIGTVYQEFKNYIQGPLAPKTITEVVTDIHKFSSYYVRMVLLKEPDLDILSAFKNITRLKVDVSYPFLLAVYDDYALNILSKEDFIKIIRYIENYVFRRAICYIPTSSLNKTFATLYKSVKKDAYLESVSAAFMLMDTYKRFPSDTEFMVDISTKDVYNFRNRNYLLSSLENFNRLELVNVEECTIEHILPQNPNLSTEWKEMLGADWKKVQDQYLHTLGNLTLTMYNSSLSDNSFTKKKGLDGWFDHSPLRLNEFLRTTDIWNEESIKERARQLSEKANVIWSTPDISPETLNKYRTVNRDTAEYTIEEYEHLTGDMLDLYGALKKRVLNIDASVREEFKKYYIAFKSITNFVDVEVQKSQLKLTLNMSYSEVIDPKGLCKDVSSKGTWGNGDVEVRISRIEELDDVMELIQQAFDIQSEM